MVVSSERFPPDVPLYTLYPVIGAPFGDGAVQESATVPSPGSAVSTGAPGGSGVTSAW
jgi:hypothetical protein